MNLLSKRLPLRLFKIFFAIKPRQLQNNHGFTIICVKLVTQMIIKNEIFK